MFYFNEFLERLNLSPDGIRLVRHDIRALAAWRRGGLKSFGCFASFQSKNRSPYAGSSIICHFLPNEMSPDGDLTALFIGITAIEDSWTWDGRRLPALQDHKIIEEEMSFKNIDAFDLQWLDNGSSFAERLVVRWGRGARSWSQWASRQNKEILELKARPHEPEFPGFSNFQARISEIPSLPQGWQQALAAANGIYLLVSDKGEQYVGSASGEGGFLARWNNYAMNGHGGNLLLKNDGNKDYTVSILEIHSNQLDRNEIFSKEAHWKLKLGSRAFGLNAN